MSDWIPRRCLPSLRKRWYQKSIRRVSAKWTMYLHQQIRTGCTYNLLILKMTVDVTRSLKLSCRLSPRRRARGSIGDISGNRSSGEKPDIDVVARPFCCIHATTDSVEPSTVRFGVLVLNITPSIGGLAWGIDIAIGSPERTGEGPIVGD